MSVGYDGCRFVDLTPSGDGVARLHRFYEGLYVREFPDPDEREALENMTYYLQHDGEHGNAYIVTLVYDDGAGGEAVAGAVCDYFERSQCGAIEFLAVAPRLRRRGIGRALASHVERRMARAASERAAQLTLVMAEINDPLVVPATSDNVDPFERLRFWDRLGYRRVDFRYVQPALSPAQAPVTTLLLAAKPVDETLSCSVPSAKVVAFLEDYLVYAMRFEDPAASPEFRAMRDDLVARATVRLTSL